MNTKPLLDKKQHDTDTIHFKITKKVFTEYREFSVVASQSSRFIPVYTLIK